MVLESNNDSLLASFYACCNTCHTRKQGLPWSGASKSEYTKRVLLIGKTESGKSRIVSCLRDSPTETSGTYEPTNGTLVSRVNVPPMDLTLVEVGGKLSEFWHRSIDSKIDGIWYIMSPDELKSRDFTVLLRFLRLSSEMLISRRLPVLVTSSYADLKSILSVQIEESGVSRVSFVQILPEYTRASLEPALDELKRSLIT